MDKEAIEKIQHLWCQHCKALQKSNGTVVECWYNPLALESPAFCAANEDAVTEIHEVYKALGYVQLDSDQSLPKLIEVLGDLPLPKHMCYADGVKDGQQTMLKQNWKRVKC